MFSKHLSQTCSFFLMLDLDNSVSDKAQPCQGRFQDFAEGGRLWFHTTGGLGAKRSHMRSNIYIYIYIHMYVCMYVCMYVKKMYVL